MIKKEANDPCRGFVPEKKSIDIDFQRVFVLIFIQNMILISFDFEV